MQIMIILCNQSKQANDAMNGKHMASFKVTSDLSYSKTVQSCLRENGSVNAHTSAATIPVFIQQKTYVKSIECCKDTHLLTWQ